ncbi:MAG: TerB family tellurite resistance protein, partial [Gammaproteobacteria bacterium]
MTDSPNFPYLLAVHMLCIDGQLHQHELQFLHGLGESTDIDAATRAAAELVLAQADQHPSLDSVIEQIIPERRPLALSLAATAAHADGVLDKTEERLLAQLKQRWKISDADYQRTLDAGRQEAERLLARLRSTARPELSTGAKLLGGLEAVIGKKVLDKVVATFGSAAVQEKLHDYRIEAMLSGPQYERAIEACRQVGLHDIDVADACLDATAGALDQVVLALDQRIAHSQARLGDAPAPAARQALRAMQQDRADLKLLVDEQLQALRDVQVKKRRAMNYYTVAFMGRSKAGKSTLHAVVTGGGWDQIGVGAQNTTRLNRVY